MLVIRREQFEVFEKSAFLLFEDDMVLHARTFSPTLCAILGDEQVQAAVHRTLSRAAQYGFTFRGPLRLFVEMMFLYGSHFDTDPQYPWAAEILRSRDAQMHRADQLYLQVLQYQERVSGPNAINTRNALRRLLTLALHPTPANLTASLIPDLMTEIFPEKVAYLGAKALSELIREGIVEAKHYEFSGTREQVLVVALMFAFGHGCTRDSLYPWIESTLTDQRISGAVGRAARLEKKAVTWLEHVIASFDGADTQ